MKRLETHINKSLICLFVLVGVIISGGIRPALAGEDPEDLFNYSFAVWLGSGFYKISDADKRLAVLRVPAGYTLRPMQSEASTPMDRLGFRLLLPAVIAYEEETETEFSFGALAFVPGLEIEIPVNKYWSLKPFGQIGAGKDTAGGTFQYIYGGGVKSLVSVPWRKFVFGIGNSWVVAEDQDASSHDTTGFSLFNAGLDIRHPVNFTIFDRQLHIGGYFVVNYFKNHVDIFGADGNTSKLKTLYEVGLTFGVSEAVSIWKVDLDRVGIDYRWGDEGLRGIGFNLGFPF